MISYMYNSCMRKKRAQITARFYHITYSVKHNKVNSTFVWVHFLHIW